MKKSMYPKVIASLTNKQKLQMTNVIGAIQGMIDKPEFHIITPELLIQTMIDKLKAKKNKRGNELPSMNEYLQLNLECFEAMQKTNDLPNSIPAKHILIMVLLNLQQRYKYGVKLTIGQTYTNKEKSNDA